MDGKAGFDLLSEAVDMHVHADPDIHLPRRMDCIDLAREMQFAGMGGFVYKSHQFPTGGLAYLIRKEVPEINAFGSISLNRTVGGLNVKALESAIKFSYDGVSLTKVVWMPTQDSAHYVRYRLTHTNAGKKVSGVGAGESGISLVEGDKLIPDVEKILQIILDRKLILATGHVSYGESKVLVARAHDIGIKKIIVTHADDRFLKMSADDQKNLIREGAFVEHCIGGCMPTIGHASFADVVFAIKEAGYQNAIISTDLGQLTNPPPVEGFRMFVKSLELDGVSSIAIHKMAVENPRMLLDL